MGALLAVDRTADGGFVATGYQGSWAGGPLDLYVVKTDPAGVAQWERRIPFPGGARGHAVRELAAGGYAIAGASSLDAEKPFVLRLTAAGATVAGWPKAYGGGASGAASALLAAGGGADGFLVAGHRAAVPGRPRLWALRTDAAGAVLWERSDYDPFCPGGADAGLAAAEAPGGGWIVAGTTGCFAGSSFLLRIGGADGAETWRRSYDPALDAAEGAVAVAARPGGGFVLAGWRSAATPSAQRDAVVLATDEAGDEVWRRTLGGAEADALNAVASTADGFVAAGVTRSYGGAVADPSQPFQWEDLLLVRGSAAGEIAWRKVKGLRPPGSDVANAVVATPDGGFVVAGASGGNALLARFDREGQTVGLGDRDLSYVVPAAEGAVRPSNAVRVARAAAIGLTRPARVGGTVLDLLTAALHGDPPGDFCTAGGSYGFAPAPALPVAPGARFDLHLSACLVPDPGGASRLDGAAAVEVTAVSGDPRTSAHALSAAVTGLSVTAQDPSNAITGTYGGAVRVERVSTAAGRTDVARSAEGPSPATFAYAEAAGASTRTVVVGPFAVTGAVDAAGARACGAAGDALTVDPDLGRLDVAVLAPLAFGAGVADPAAGAFRVSAPDGSTLTATVTGPGLVELAVDTDGDGVADGALSTAWDELD
jgi:hypothetical protein